jgi:DNA-binding transcriptional LysR family regulator
MWLPDLERAIGDVDGEIDVAITCGLVSDLPGITSEVFCAEPLVVGLRADHRLAGHDAVDLSDLSVETLGTPSDALFPAWSMALGQVLQAAGVSPPTVELADTDLSACRWSAQPEVDWILTTTAISGREMTAPLRPVAPTQLVPYTLHWCPIRAATAAVGRFVHLALSVDVPAGWVTQPDHLHHSQD